MKSFDFRLNIAPDGAEVFPLTERALYELERARHDGAAPFFHWFPCELAELAELHGRGYTFC